MAELRELNLYSPFPFSPSRTEREDDLGLPHNRKIAGAIATTINWRTALGWAGSYAPCPAAISTRRSCTLRPLYRADAQKAVSPGCGHRAEVRRRLIALRAKGHARVLTQPAVFPKAGQFRPAMRRSSACTACTSNVSRFTASFSDSDRLTRTATEGDLAAPRPGMLDMLGRAKW